MAIVLDGNSLSFEVAEDIIFNNKLIEISESALERVERSRKIVENIVKNDRVVYGITTGFGSLKNVIVKGDDAKTLQKNLLRSHAVGVGDVLSYEIVRGMLLLRLNSLLKGYSGVKVKTVLLMKDILNKGLYPYVPSRGSVGASGDLAPLAHLGLCLIGEGRFIVNNSVVKADKVLKDNGLSSIELAEKEGLALINGTQLMSSILLFILHRLKSLINQSLLAASMSLEALMGTRTAFREEIHKLRPHPGQKMVANLVYQITERSEIINSHKSCDRVQDAYSLRCIPQVVGAIVDTFLQARRVLDIELNAVTDNPIVIGKDDVVSGGNFHGEPIALNIDFINLSMIELGNIIERRVDRLVNADSNKILPPFLVYESGLNSGFMIVQYLAASLTNENKSLAYPATADTIPTSANQEDHVSMGPSAGFKALRVLDNLETLIAIEFLTAVQALDFVNFKSSDVISETRKLIREYISFMKKDRIISDDIKTMVELVKGDVFYKIMERGGLSLIA